MRYVIFEINFRLTNRISRRKSCQALWPTPLSAPATKTVYFLKKILKVMEYFFIFHLVLIRKRLKVRQDPLPAH